MYHFAHLENQIDAALAKLFELQDNTADMINGSVDFLKRASAPVGRSMVRVFLNHPRREAEEDWGR
jgi:hypothetical protein